MTAMSITRPRSGAVAARPSHPKVSIVGEQGRRLTLPYAPTGSSLAGWSPSWATLARPGRKPLVVRDADGLLTLAFEVLIAARDHQTSVEPTLAQLRALAAAGDRVTVVNGSPLERGPWRLESVTVTATLRQHGTNAITRAAVALTFLEASDGRVRLGPVSGGKKNKPKRKNPQKAQKYTVKKGDTLRGLADKFYGEPDEWRRIAKANGIKDPGPKALKVGKVITIPADDDKPRDVLGDVTAVTF